MLKVFEACAGYGGGSFALKKAGIEHEVVGYSEIDKYAIQCYSQNHANYYSEAHVPGTEHSKAYRVKNYGDITKIDPNEIPDFDLFLAGFPCQPFSVAGKGKGEQDTRGTLFHEIIRICEVKKPKYIVLENVRGLTFKNHKKTFDKILSELRRIGYAVFWKVLNSKEHGIPQNRERVFFICYRKDLLKEFTRFDFPEKEELKIFLKDILEDEVDEKYYLSEKQITKLREYLGKKNKINADVMNCMGTCFGRSGSSKEELESYARLNKVLYISSTQKHNTIRTDGISNALPSAMGMGGGHTPMIKQLNNPKHSNNRVFSPEGISPTLNTMQGGHRQPFIAIKNATKKGYLEGYPGDGVNLEHPNSKTRRGRIQKDVIGTLQTNDQRGVLTKDFRIRKLTPKECFRLMGFLDDEINLDGISNYQRYKLAGNGWDINLVSKIFKKIF